MSEYGLREALLAIVAAATEHGVNDAVAEKIATAEVVAGTRGLRPERGSVCPNGHDLPDIYALDCLECLEEGTASQTAYVPLSEAMRLHSALEVAEARMEVRPPEYMRGYGDGWTAMLNWLAELNLDLDEGIYSEALKEIVRQLHDLPPRP